MRTFYFLIGLLLVLLLLLPTFLSTPFGKKQLEHRISARTGGTLTIDSLSCSWWGRQKIEGVQLRDAQNRLIFQAPSLEIDSPLWKVLLLSDIGHSTLTAPEYLVLDSPLFLSHFPSHWQSCQLFPIVPNRRSFCCLGRRESCRNSKNFYGWVLASSFGLNLTSLSGIVEVIEGQVAVAVPQIDPVLFKHIHLKAILPRDKKQIELTLQCETLQQQVAGKVDLKASIGDLQAPRPSINAEATLVKLPVQGIDQWVGRFSGKAKGLLLDLIGPMMDLSIQLQSSPETFELNLTALSPQFSAQLSTQNAHGWISLKNPGLIRLTLPPSSFAKFSQIFPSLKGILLTQPATFLLNVAELSMPQGNLKKLKVDATLSSEKQCLWMFKEIPIALESLECRFLTPDVEDPLYVSGQAILTIDHQSCNVISEMKCRHLLRPSRECSGSLQVTEVPTPFIAQWMEWPLTSADHLGSTLSGALQFSLTPNQSQFEGSIDTPRLHLPSLAFSADKGFHLLKPATLSYQCPSGETIDGTVSQLDASFSPLKILSAIELPLAQHAALNALLGAQLQCKLKIEPAAKSAHMGYFEVTSSQFQGNGVCLFDTQSIQSQKCQIRWTLLPEAYPLLDKLLTGQTKTPFVLQSPSTFDIRLEELYIPLDSLAQEGSLVKKALTQWRFNAHGRNPLFTFSDPSTKESIQLSNSTFDCDPNHLTLHTQIQKESQGSFDCSITREASTPFRGTFALKAQQFPSQILDILARTQGHTESPFSALFGKSLDAEASLSLHTEESPVTLSVRSPQTQMTLNGTCHQGVLRLNQPFFFQTHLTPEVGRLFSKKIHLYAKSPISLEIPPQGVSIPLSPFTASELNIPDARIDLGKIYCQNEGNLHIALELLKKQSLNKEELMLWFAPIDLHTSKGVIDVERTEILIADTFDVAIWGKTNLKKNYVDMLLGLPAETLQKAFDIQGLPKDYVLTIPVKGPLDNVEIDTGKATGKLALLYAWQKRSLAGNITKNPAGAIFGEVVGQLALLPDRDAVIPPAKHPFPWESHSGPAKKDSSSSSKKRHFSLKEKPLKQLLKVIR